MDETLYNNIVKLLRAECNHGYIGRLYNVDVKLMAGVQDGTVQPQQKHSRAKTEKQLAPATKTFPLLTDDMTDGDIIIALTKHGMAAQKIRKYLKLQLTAKSISKYATKKLGPATRGVNNSRDNQLGVYMILLVTAILEDAFGKNRYECEICLEPVPQGCVIHHTKYQGATIYDLMFICGSCNQSRVNKGLA